MRQEKESIWGRARIGGASHTGYSEDPSMDENGPESIEEADVDEDILSLRSIIKCS